MLKTEILIYAFAGGVFPAVLWLWFWLREDKKNPEPRRILFLTFLGGMIATLPAAFFQFWLGSLSTSLPTIFGDLTISIVAFAAVEELVKFVASYATALRTKENDEPIDSVIYLITAALGFAALENTIFIIGTLLESPTGTGLVSSIVVGNVRFVGASLLHVASSAAIGVFMGLSFYSMKLIKIIFIVSGILMATILHAYFNFLIMNMGEIGFLLSFPFAWILIVILILFFEKIKRVRI